MVKLVFDLDGTLYSYRESGVDKATIALIVQYIMRRFNLSHEEAEQRCMDYYHKYGITGRGLALLHDDFDMQEYCACAHSFDVALHVKHDLKLREQLVRLVAAIGGRPELWILTNATASHARSTLAVLGIADLFMDVHTGELRLIDCFEQWNSGAANQYECKPCMSAYTHTAKRINVAAGERVIFFEDSAGNLTAPKELGWTTVHITDGRPVPADRSAWAWDFVAADVYTVLDDLIHHALVEKAGIRRISALGGRLLVLDDTTCATSPYTGHRGSGRRQPARKQHPRYVPDPFHRVHAGDGAADVMRQAIAPLSSVPALLVTGALVAAAFLAGRMSKN